MDKMQRVRCRTPQGCVDRNLNMLKKDENSLSRTPQGCVDRNMGCYVSIYKLLVSHPAGVRG